MNPRYPKPMGEDGGPSCRGCALEHAGFGFALPSGPVGAPLQFLGESLGFNEAIEGEAFVGAAGGTLSRILTRAGVDRRQVRIGNSISCRPPGDFLVGASYEEHAINHCRVYRDPFFAAIPDGGVLIPLGMTATDAALNLRGVPGINMKDVQNTVWRDPTNRFWVVPTFHPSHLQRGAMNLLECVTQTVQLAHRISQRGFVRSPSELIVDPHPDWLATWSRAYIQQLIANPDGVHLAIDTEFVEKSGGADESEVVLNAQRSPITRVNGACDGRVGWTVPYREPYISILRELFSQTVACRGNIWMWNKYADLDHLWADGHVIPNELVIDGMWCLGKQTQVPTWNGNTYTIAEIVENRLDVLLIGMDHDGTRVPVRISEYHKTQVRGQKWLALKTRVRRPPIYCTPDHRIWTQDGWKEAGAVVVGDRIPTSQIGSDDLIHGTILGDGHVTRRGDLTMCHGADQRVWLMAKSWHLGTAPFDRSRGWVQAGTPVGLDWRRKFYDAKGIKHFVPPPSNAALAVWFCDDGNYHRNKGAKGLGRVRIACDSFMKDRDFIVSWFRARFGPHVRFHGQKRPILVISRDSLRRFFDSVAPYVHSSMDYKLHEGWRHLYNGWLERKIPRWGEVISIKPSIVPKGSARYCVTVNHPQHRFFTVGGLVSNCWHYLQSDLPRGLGFVAAMASDFGAWKHWAKDSKREGEYAAADGVQTWRTCMWILSAMHKQGIWEIFIRDWHERDVHVLRPAYVQGVPANRDSLEKFHAELQVKLASVLERIKLTAAEGTLKPKLGYAKRPGKKCAMCKGKGSIERIEGEGPWPVRFTCEQCHGGGVISQLAPPASILGKQKSAKSKTVAGREAIGGEAKSSYMIEGVSLVEREIEVEINRCITCGTDDVGAKHRCKLPAKPKAAKRRRAKDDGDGSIVGQLESSAGAVGSVPAARMRPVASLVRIRTLQVRYFWQLPFNPDAPAQVLAYLASQGIAAPIDKKRNRATTNKKALADLAVKHRDDPFFQLQLDWKAVQKVDSTYAVGALARLDANDMLHPEFVCIPSTLRDSCRGVNIQNVVADKAGPDGLASGFRKCIESRQGIPADRTPEELATWEARWGTK